MMSETANDCVAGLPWRVGVFVRTLHPDILGVNFIWRPGAEVEVGSVNFDMLDAPEFKASPLAIVFKKATEVRAHMDDAGSKHFPIVEDMRAEGVTDYVALPILFIDGSIHASSWTTKQPGGFSEEQLNALRSLVRVLARIIEIFQLRRKSSILLDTYVGNRAGERILGGQIRRGHTDTMHAAIWLSDLRGFTALSDRLPAETVVDIRNQYFDCQVSAIRAWRRGPQIHGRRASRCFRSMNMSAMSRRSARACWKPPVILWQRRGAALSDRRGYLPRRFRFGVALHVRKNPAGNIGGGNRLDATVHLHRSLPSILRHGWKRSPAASDRTISGVEGLAGTCRAACATISREFRYRSPVSSKAEHVYGLVDETRTRRLANRKTRGSFLRLGGEQQALDSALARPASVARVALVSATSLVKTATTQTPRQMRCDHDLVGLVQSRKFRFSTVTTNSRA
jgi:adenylate cyclase